MTDSKLSFNMSTRGELAKYREQVFADDTLSDTEKIKKLIEILERLKPEAVAESERDANPRSISDRVNAAFNAMVVAPDRPLEEDIDKVITELRAILQDESAT